jgi:redox-sensitive bicupin YhaK (pirin superfamily)
MSPSDLGEHLKPFVFLDLFEPDMRAMAGGMPVHPQSGIATITVFTEGDATFDHPQAGHGTVVTLKPGEQWTYTPPAAPHSYWGLRSHIVPTPPGLDFVWIG